jgi:hypothetical protein
VIFDHEMSLNQSSELEGSEVNVPQSVVYFLESDVLSDECGSDVDPFMFPPDPAVSTEIAWASPRTKQAEFTAYYRE